MTSCGNRNPAKLDLGAGTRTPRRRITSSCRDLASTDATDPMDLLAKTCWHPARDHLGRQQAAHRETGPSVKLRHVTPSPEPTVVELIAPNSAAAHQILRCYRDEIISRYYGRQATDQEIDAAIREDPSDDLTLPHGALLVAHQDDAIWGCAGLRFLPDRIGEVKRVFIAPAARTRARRSTHGRGGMPRSRARSIHAAARHPPRPRRGTSVIRLAGLPGSTRLQRQPLRRSLVRKDAQLRE
jgi:hypothetical protein